MKQEILKLLQAQGLLGDDRVFEIKTRLEKGEELEAVLDSFQVPDEKVADAKSQIFNLQRLHGLVYFLMCFHIKTFRF